MATGGVALSEQNLDSRITCCVCLEDFKGRKPKILPCFHTFCLPCLNQLTRTWQGDSQGAAQATVTFPTCRAIHVLNPAGAKDLQDNFYIDSDPASSVNQPDIAMATQDRDPSHDLWVKVEEQVKVLEVVTSRLAEEEKEIERQKKVAELEVRQHYEAGLQMLEECRDHCLSSVAEVSQQLTDKEQADLLFAHSLLKPLQDLATCPNTPQTPSPGSSNSQTPPSGLQTTASRLTQ